MYKASEHYITMELSEVLEEDRPRRRLEIDFEGLLIGPTGGGEAARLAKAAVSSNGAVALAKAMKEAAERYLATEEKVCLSDEAKEELSIGGATLKGAK